MALIMAVGMLTPMAAALDEVPEAVGLSSAFVAPLSTEEPLLTELTIRTSTSTADWSNALLAGEANTSGVAVYSPETTAYTLPNVTDSTTQLRFWFNKREDVTSIVLHWGDEGSKTFSATTNQWANCLTGGRNTIKLVVTAADGVSAEYTFVIDVAPSLTALDITNGGIPVYLDKTFAGATKDYTVQISQTAQQVSVTATPKNEAYTVTYNSTDTGLVDIFGASAVEVCVFAGAVSSTYTVTLERVAAYTATINAEPADAIVLIYDAQGSVLARGLGAATADDVLSANYVVTKNGYITQTGSISDATPVPVTLEKAPEWDLAEMTGDWTSFRGNAQHMGITSAKTPATAETAIQKWAAKYGSGWSAAPTPPLIMNDALYIAVSSKVLKLDIQTGETLQESDALLANVGFAMNPIAYGDGMFFVPIGKGRVQALNAFTLESLWVSENLGNIAQTNAPLVYHDGYLYTGVWNKEDLPGTFFCLSVTDEDPTSKTEVKQCSWKYTHTAGFYWAGAYVTGDYLIVGSDDGLPEGTYEQSAVLFSLDPKTGAKIDSVTGIKGDIRSSVSYDESTGRIYFATKGGWFCTIKVNKDGTFDDDSFNYIDLGGMCTGTPLVYNNRAYIGSSGSQGQFGPGKLHVIDLTGETPQIAYSADLPGYPQASALLSTAYGDKTYIYITYNMTPGGIYVLEDSPLQTTSKGYDLFIPGVGMQQYAIASLVADSSGTIYYKNDSCYLMAVGRNEAYLSNLTAEAGEFDHAFSTGTLDYELVVPVGTTSVTLAATPVEGAVVTINGEAPAALTLINGKATATIAVTKDMATRTYTVKIREISTNASLSHASANMKNSLEGGKEFSLEENAGEFSWSDTDASTFRRIWVKPTDDMSTVTASVVHGVATAMNGAALAEGSVLSPNAGTGTSVGYTRFNVNFAANCAEATIKVTVKAEDGATTREYLFTVTRPDSYTPVLSGASATRTSDDTGRVCFTSSKSGSYYYQVVASGAAKPTIDTTVAGTAFESTGNVTINLSGLTPGVKDVYVRVKNAAGNVSAVLKIVLPAKNSEDGGSDGGTPKEEKITVSFRLIGSSLSKGDVDLGTNDYSGAQYQTWVKAVYVTLNKNATVYDVFTTVLDDAGLAYTGAERNYIDTIYAPAVLGGYALSEFTNGQRSGWMYTVNNTHPRFGLMEWTLQDGDAVVWHYVNDYSYEVSDWFDDDPRYPALGDGTYYNKWLMAPDVEPTAPNEDESTGEGEESPETTLQPDATVDKDGEATVIVDEVSLKKALENAGAEGSAMIVIAPQINGNAARVLVEMPASALASLAKGSKANIRIKTPIGEITIPNDALANVAAQASGSTITARIEAIKTTALTAEQQAAVGTNAVYDLSLFSGNKPISQFGGKSISIALPYTLKSGETADGVAVWYLNDDGRLERIACTYDKRADLATFDTTHLSNYVVGYDAWVSPFADVETDDWFYAAVKYAARNELFKGTSETTFSPDANMTRAMLVTVMYRLEGAPAFTASNTFADVAQDEWYTNAILWANAKGIVTGYDDGFFGTNDPITREQMATMLLRYARYKNYDTQKANDLAAFADGSSIASYALDAMKWANAEGLITGRTATTLAPTGPATRAEVATILMRFAENVVK